MIRTTLTCLTLCLATPALANECGGGSTTHQVTVAMNGFFPSELFVCPGDKIYFTNKSGYWAKFNQSYIENGNQFHSYWMSNGSTVGPMEVSSTMGMQIENLDLWDVDNYTYPMQLTFGTPTLSN